MRLRREVRRVADALDSSFKIFPRTDYRNYYPRKSASERMSEAWERTARDLDGAITGFGWRERTR
jgi:hypothetical protein